MKRNYMDQYIDKSKLLGELGFIVRFVIIFFLRNCLFSCSGQELSNLSNQERKTIPPALVSDNDVSPSNS